MKFSRLLAFGLVGSILVGSGTVSYAWEGYREVHCEVGSVVDVGRVNSIEDEEDGLVEILPSGLVEAVGEGVCWLDLSDGTRVCLVVGGAVSPNSIGSFESEKEVKKDKENKSLMKETEYEITVEEEVDNGDNGAGENTLEPKNEETVVDSDESFTERETEVPDKNETDKVEGDDAGESTVKPEVELRKETEGVLETELITESTESTESTEFTESTESTESDLVETEDIDVETIPERNERVSESESELESVTEVESETTGEQESDIEESTESASEAEKESEVATEVETEVSVETESEVSTGTESEVSVETESEVSTEVESESDSEVETEVGEETETESESEISEESVEESESEFIIPQKAIVIDNTDTTETDVSDYEVSIDNDKLGEDGYVSVPVETSLRENEISGRVGEYFVVPVLGDSDSEYVSTDESVAKVSENGVVLLTGVGRCRIIVSSSDKLYACDVTSIDPVFDGSDVTLRWDENYTFDIGGNLLGEPVTYSLVKGKDIASISDTGEVNFTGSGYVIARASVAGVDLNKKITSNSRRKVLWDGMQPAIQQCLGTPYVFGGFAPGSGLDCSGYVSYVYNTVGLMSGRTTAQGLYNMFGVTSNPQPGDVVYFAGTYACSDYITHVGIYAGDGMMYHSGKPNQKTAITGYYAQHLVGYGSITGE